jgi:Fe-S-cluster containining protein
MKTYWVSRLNPAQPRISMHRKSRILAVRTWEMKTRLNQIQNPAIAFPCARYPTLKLAFCGKSDHQGARPLGISDIWYRRVMYANKPILKRVLCIGFKKETAKTQIYDYCERACSHCQDGVPTLFSVFSSHFVIYFREFDSGVDREPLMRRTLAMRSPVAKSR